MKTKTIIPLVIGIVFGFVAIKLGFDAIRKAQAGSAPVETVEVIVANVDIASTAELTPEMLTVKKTPKSPLIGEGAFSNTETLLTRVTAKSIPQGSIILESMLAPPGTKPGLEVRIQEGYRAVSVKTDEVSGVAYNLRPGDFVDVIVVMNVQRGGKKETISNILLQRVQVGGVGQWLDDPGKKDVKARSVTLLVKDEDAPKLHLAQTKGTVTLAMRGAEDERLSAFEATSERILTGDEDATVFSAANGAIEPDAGAAQGLMAMDVAPGAAATPEYIVTVFNGPVNNTSTSAVHRVVYANQQSMEVLRTENGRAGKNGDQVSPESVMNLRRSYGTDRRDRGRGGMDRLDPVEPGDPYGSYEDPGATID